MTELFNNIRGLYRFKAPCDELKAHIEFFSESCFDSTKQIVKDRFFSIKMFKSWTPTFWINLGPAYNLVLNGYAHKIKANSAIAVTRNVTMERVNHATDHLFTVKFYPGALRHLIGAEQTRMNGGWVELNQLLPGSLIQKITLAESFNDRIDMMQQYLLEKIGNNKATDHYTTMVTQTIALYTENGLRFNVNELAVKNFTSSRTLRRYFDRVIGVSPKQYVESIRLRTALSSFLHDRKNFDPAVYGYYDKSHFYRSVTDFTGERITNQN